MAQIQYQLLYDADCPLCVWYTGYFKKHGYLQPDEVVPMQKANVSTLPYLHKQKMINEIPLVDIAQQSVRYGTNAILTIIAKKHPLLAKMAGWQVFQPFIKTLYSFISFNRKVITGTLPTCSTMSCAPAFHLPYRMAFVICMQLLVTVFFLPDVKGYSTMPPTWWMATVTILLSVVFMLQKHQQALYMEIIGQLSMLLLFTSVAGWIAGTLHHLFQSEWLTAIITTTYVLLLLLPQAKQRWQYIQLQYKLYKTTTVIAHE